MADCQLIIILLGDCDGMEILIDGSVERIGVLPSFKNPSVDMS